MSNMQSTVREKVTIEQMREEFLAMLQVCFEGEATLRGNEIDLRLPSGECFFISVGAA
jgi:mannose-6-phosphate isomerase class I